MSASAHPVFSSLRLRRLGLFVLLGVLLAGMWYLGFRQGGSAAVKKTTHAIRTGGYQYINPLLMCDSQQNDQSSQSASLTKELQDLIDHEKNLRHVDRVSVWARDATTGHGVDINVDDVYSPASLLKVPFLLSFEKASEEDPQLFSKTYPYVATDNADDPEYFKSTVQLQQGHAYTVAELLREMIVHSSNQAYTLLLAHVEQKHLDDLYALTGIQIPKQGNPFVDFLSPKQYMQFFRVLYNGTYLSHESSEDVLTLLTQAEFNDGLVKGFPDSIQVAHKFGERGVTSSDTQLVEKRELHDCGIAYIPNHTTLICVMTQGDSFPDLANVIAETAKTVYDATQKGF